MTHPFRVSRRALLSRAAFSAASLTAMPWLSACQHAPTATPQSAAPTAVQATTEPATSAPAPTQAPSQKVTLRWWSYFSPDDRGGLFEPISQEYMANNPNVSFDLAHGVASYNEKVATAFASGDPPELFGIQHYQFMLLVNEKSVTDLTEWYAQSGAKDRVHPAAQAWCSIDGKPYGFSAHDLFADDWYYNAALFEKAGLQEPKNTEDFFALTEPLRAAGAHFPCILGAADTWTWVMLYSIFQAQTAGLSALLEATDKKDYHLPTLKEAFDLIGRMFREGMLPQDTLAVDYAGAEASFVGGDAAMYPAITAIYSGLKKAAEGADPERFELSLFKQAPLFTEEPLSPWAAGYGMVWAVAANNRNMQPTLDFLTYYASPDVQKRLVEINGIPPLPETWDNIKDPLLRVSVQHMKEATAEGLFICDFLHPMVQEAIAAGLRKLGTGEGTSEQILDAMTAAIRAI